MPVGDKDTPRYEFAVKRVPVLLGILSPFWEGGLIIGLIGLFYGFDDHYPFYEVCHGNGVYVCAQLEQVIAAATAVTTQFGVAIRVWASVVDFSELGVQLVD